MPPAISAWPPSPNPTIPTHRPGATGEPATQRRKPGTPTAARPRPSPRKNRPDLTHERSRLIVIDFDGIDSPRGLARAISSESERAFGSKQVAEASGCAAQPGWRWVAVRRLDVTSCPNRRSVLNSPFAGAWQECMQRRRHRRYSLSARSMTLVDPAIVCSILGDCRGCRLSVILKVGVRHRL